MPCVARSEAETTICQSGVTNVRPFLQSYLQLIPRVSKGIRASPSRASSIGRTPSHQHRLQQACPRRILPQRHLLRHHRRAAENWVSCLIDIGIAISNLIGGALAIRFVVRATHGIAPTERRLAQPTSFRSAYRMTLAIHQHARCCTRCRAQQECSQRCG